MSPRARRATALLLYLLAVFAFFEVSSRAALSRKDFFRRVAGIDAASSRLRWAKRQRQGRPLVLPFDAYHPTRGWTLRPNLDAVPAFGGKTLSSTSRGYRGRRNVPRVTPEGRVRVAALGDSFTFGEDVGDSETWVHQLGVMEPTLETVNLGIHAYGHDQMLITLREEGPWLRPDVVLVGFVHIDLERNRTAFFDYAKPWFEREGETLVLRGVPVPTPEALRAREPWRSRFVDLLSMLHARIRERSGMEARARRELGEALLSAIRDTAKEMGARAIFVYLPILDEIGAPEASAGELLFQETCRRQGLTCVSLRPSFSDRVQGGQHLKRRGHWGPVEHHAAAQDLLRLLADKELAFPPRARGAGAP